MAEVTMLIFHRPADPGASELVQTLAAVRAELAERHARMFRHAGAAKVRIESEWHEGSSFGEVMAAHAPARGGLIVMSGGAVPLLNARDASELIATAGASRKVALTNNRYSSDVCAVADAGTLRRLPALPSDNALPRWLEEHAGYAVAEMAARQRLGIDLDTPLDIALTALARTCPHWLRAAAHDAELAIPRLDDVRALGRDPYAELLLFGRAGSRTLGWLERHVRCRVRFLAEERGLRASSPLAIKSTAQAASRPAARSAQPRPRATLGLLLDEHGPQAFADIIATLGQGAIVDTRVLLAHRLGTDETYWPAPAERFASDLHRHAEIEDQWLKALTASAARSRMPILLGGHSLVGPGVPLLLGGAG